MATHVLPENTLISSLVPSGGGTLASGDTIELSGHDLIIDADAVSYPVSLNNTGATAHLELRDGGRIKLNATLPTSICPWVDPKNPLPESNYTAGLTANASAEIQLNGNFSLGGGVANLPTGKRNGDIFAVVAGSTASNSLTFDRLLNLHSGDYIVNLTNVDVIQRLEVASCDGNAVVFTSNPSRRINGDIWGVVCGGVAVNRLTANASTTIINSDVVGGTLLVLQLNGTSNPSDTIKGNISVGRICACCGTQYSYGVGETFGHGANVCADEIVTAKLVHKTYNNNLPSFVQTQIRANRVAVAALGWDIDFFNGWIGDIHIGGGYISAFTKTYCCAPNIISFKDMEKCPVVVGGGKQWAAIYKNSKRDGVLIADTQFENEGTVSRVARSDFPTDTDIPDAFYFAPATAADVTWRYEDMWVRKGETLRIACRAMRGGDNGVARVAIGEMAVWVPAAGMPTLAEWTLDSGEPLVWRGGTLAWTNDTGEDRQVRVWSMGSGINGAYIRVWRATGGAM